MKMTKHNEKNLMECPKEIFFIIFDFMSINHLKKIHYLNKIFYYLLLEKESEYWNFRHGYTKSRAKRYMERKLLKIPPKNEVKGIIEYKLRNTDLYKNSYDILLQCINKFIELIFYSFYIEIKKEDNEYKINDGYMDKRYNPTKEESKRIYNVFNGYNEERNKRKILSVLMSDIRNLGYILEISFDYNNTVKISIKIK